jgi:competence protein ComGC
VIISILVMITVPNKLDMRETMAMVNKHFAASKCIIPTVV